MAATAVWKRALDLPAPAALVRDDWARRNADLEAVLRDGPPRDYLRHPSVAFQMFVGEHHAVRELPYVTDRLGGDRALLAEPAAGDPPTMVLDDGTVTSSNTVHHVFHLLRYEQATARAPAEHGVVVEWGAGYGNLGRLLRARHGGAPTLVLIDTPVFSALQHLHLTAVLGADAVVLHQEPGAPVVAGRVNVVPLGLVAALAVRADLFVSTWALNESTQAAQALVLEREWFGAPALLLAFHRGDPLEPAVLTAGAEPLPLGAWMPGQHYFVR